MEPGSAATKAIASLLAATPRETVPPPTWLTCL